MSFPIPPQPDPAGPGARAVPQDVTTAFQLWCGVLALAVVTTVLGVVDLWQSRDVLVDTMLEVSGDAAADGITAEQLEDMMPMAFGLTVVVGVLIVGVLFLVVRQMRNGKNWARMTLTLIGVFMSLTTLPTVFGVGVGTGATGWLVGALGIVQIVATVGAIVLMHRRESNRYFLRLPAN
ncbi:MULTISPECIES: hypothetical protein [Rhodococcus]|uniref:hypothetical protein n=1 Tax=Rhodococcus TaxID=1827 RepID=UPI001CF8EFA9|nr:MULTISPECIES: hypothetical protein [Rhodococcus]